jgi:DNA helicase IV
MGSNESIKVEQDYVDKVLDIRESKRTNRKSGKPNLREALSQPVNSMAGGGLQDLRYLGDPTDEVCFANFVDDKSTKIYLGKHLITDDEFNALVISWRAPVASKYYQASYLDSKGLISKCRLIFQTTNRIKDLEESIFSNLKDNILNLTKSADLEISDSVLDELEKGSNGSLKEIIRTIHASQYEIISTQRGGLHVVQGAPGTGKTVVGIHRASWLLFPGNDESLTSNKVLILGPNASFIKYIEDLLPSLGNEVIQHTDLTKLSSILKVNFEEKNEIAKLKSGQRIKKLLRNAIKDRLKIPEEDIQYQVPGQIKTVNLSSDWIKESITELRKERITYNSGRSKFRMLLVNEINDILQGNKGVKKLISRNSVFIKESDADALLEKIWPSLNALNLVRDLFSSQNRLVSAALDTDFLVSELILLEKKSSDKKDFWSESDVAVVDYVDGLLFGVRETYDYIIVDEAQDLTPMQIESIKKRSSNGDILLLGDLAQATGNWQHNSWEELADLMGTTISRFDELKFGYRVPSEVFHYATKILSHIDSNLKPPKLVRQVNQVPEFNEYPDKNVNLYQLATDIKDKKFGDGHIGLIARDDQVEELRRELNEWDISFTELNSNSIKSGLNIVPVSQQKGLEFDSVIVYEPESILDIPVIGLRHLYVAVTRSLRGLYFYSTTHMPLELKELSNQQKVGSSVNSSFNRKVLDTDPVRNYILEDIKGYAEVKGVTLEQIKEILENETNYD